MSTDQDDPLIAGRYRVVEELGRGAQGVVLGAVDARAGESAPPVALKTVAGERVGAAEVALLRSEFERLRAVAHPALVQVEDFVVDRDGRPWLVSRRVEGKSLLDAAPGAAGSRERAEGALRLVGGQNAAGAALVERTGNSP